MGQSFFVNGLTGTCLEISIRASRLTIFPFVSGTSGVVAGNALDKHLVKLAMNPLLIPVENRPVSQNHSILTMLDSALVLSISFVDVLRMLNSSVVDEQKASEPSSDDKTLHSG